MPRAKQSNLTPAQRSSAKKKGGGEATPAMRQYLDQKAEVPDAVLLFRMGDFYETFYDDAKLVARVLGLSLTARNKDAAEPIPLAGIPYHALNNYLGKLVRAGYKVAISEQVEDPKEAKGVVRREIQRIVTPGTLTDDALLDARSENFLAAVCNAGPAVGVAWADLSTGRFEATITPLDSALDELVRRGPAEVLTADIGIDEVDALSAAVAAALPDTALTKVSAHHFDPYVAERVLHEHFGVATLAGFGFEETDAAVRAAGALLAYIAETQKTAAAHMQTLRNASADAHVRIDRNTWRSLELDRTLREHDASGALLGAIDRTANPMGARLLRRWLSYPLCDAGAIAERQDAVAELLAAPDAIEALRRDLREIADVERIVARVGVGRALPRDLAGLSRSLAGLRALRDALSPLRSALLCDAAGAMDGLDELADLLNRAVKPEPPATVREGGIIADGYDAELDRLRSLQKDARQWLAEFQQAECQRTGIPSLKVGFNNVFGYYIEITNAHRDRAPEDYIRKQTLKNAERYITQALKEHEEEVLSARDKANALEYDLFCALCAGVAAEIAALMRAADAVAAVDVLAGFAKLAAERNYVRPTIADAPIAEIVGGRHPVLEQSIHERFVPNDWRTDADGDRLLLITGPNMAGKSTYIRQNALLVILAQMGAFVPAEGMRWGLVDRIFARVGSADDLSRGQSTFMVEMTEAANILNNATPRSLVILDEIGRGTSTFDGLALAWAIAEYLVREGRCRSLFATHYHELTELAGLFEGVRNLNVSVREHADDVIFMHSIVDGSAGKSYGIHVARLAGVPAGVVARAKEVLAELEAGFDKEARSPRLARRRTKTEQPMLAFPDPNAGVADALREIDVESLTPIEALNRLAELKKKLDS